MQLSHNEYLIMELLWKEQRPLSCADIKEAVGRDWNMSSIHLLLDSMQSKGAVKAAGGARKYGRTYEAAATQEEYMLKCVDNGMPGRPDEEKLLGMVLALVTRPGVSERDIASLESILRQKRQELRVRRDDKQKR